MILQYLRIQKGMPKFETADSDVPEQKYKELSKIVGNYWQKNKDMTMSQINQHQNNQK